MNDIDKEEEKILKERIAKSLVGKIVKHPFIKFEIISVDSIENWDVVEFGYFFVALTIKYFGKDLKDLTHSRVRYPMASSIYFHLKEEFVPLKVSIIGNKYLEITEMPIGEYFLEKL